ncbi:substrate-binding domain-containing protein [Falsiroseomonas selenitidurans]|uniref:4,5-dihydroxyphthalate decarboxylase n=1 Tax=Falsiroseomonas selenitidurans TaxID=2716335 RepID=A0ABX1EAF9_9PROT|nr:4,5-dihydroxyphthalate decarboxylase [Falsiroseomonas selenitidurans]NKC34229.1 4,5-dihydroxyphthalate decarboxylase [Falsiroseomonas selenitidurans]
MRTLTVACAPYDRVRGLFDGRVPTPGLRLVPVPIHSEQSFPRAFTRAEFDVTELSLSSHLMQVSRGEAGYVAIPAFVSRAFRHGCIYLRADAGIATAKDLEGRRVGIPEYQMTLGLWLRGILADDHGVAVNGIAWRTAGTNAAGRRERLPLELPPGMEVRPLGEGATLNAALLEGTIDAILSPTEPAAFAAGDPRVVRLFPDPRAAATAWHRRTGFHPIMHLIGIRREILAEDPTLARRLYEAFLAAKQLALADLEADLRHSSLSIMLPFLAEEWAATRALLGADPWTYGVTANRAELAAICRWSAAQHLARRELRPADIFAEGMDDT